MWEGAENQPPCASPGALHRVARYNPAAVVVVVVAGCMFSVCPWQQLSSPFLLLAKVCPSVTSVLDLRNVLFVPRHSLKLKDVDAAKLIG